MGAGKNSFIYKLCVLLFFFAKDLTLKAIIRVGLFLLATSEKGHGKVFSFRDWIIVCLSEYEMSEFFIYASVGICQSYRCIVYCQEKRLHIQF